MIALLFVISPSIVFADETPFSSGDLFSITNNTPFYDPSAASADTGSCDGVGLGITLTGDGNGVKAFNFFISKGMTPMGASGIVGNLSEESTGVDPERLQGHYDGEQPAESDEVQALIDDSLTGWGIAQWTPPNKIITASYNKGTSYAVIDTLAFQLQFLWNEIKDRPEFLNQMNTAATPEDSAEVFRAGFEKGNPASTRGSYARAYYELATNNSPLPPNVPVSHNDGTVSGSADPTGSGNTSTCASTGSYQNPMRDVKSSVTGKIVPMRIDEGVDYGGDGPVYALGNAVVKYADDTTGWPGDGGAGTFISYKLIDGPAKGHWVYIAENCTDIKVSVGQTVNTNTVLCTEHDNWPFIETGWAIEQPQDLAASYSVYQTVPDGTATAYGKNFSDLMVSLGAPAGTYQFPNQRGGQNLAGTLPEGWPTW
jgi:hypothetical protein